MAGKPSINPIAARISTSPAPIAFSLEIFTINQITPPPINPPRRFNIEPSPIRPNIYEYSVLLRRILRIKKSKFAKAAKRSILFETISGIENEITSKIERYSRKEIKTPNTNVYIIPTVKLIFRISISSLNLKESIIPQLKDRTNDK